MSLAPRLFPLSQEQLTSDDYYTPAWVFERLGITFDLDVCSPPGGVEWIPATRFFTQEDDGLAQEWVGRVWMNPPFSGCTPWVDRFIEHAHGVCLIQMSKGAYTRRLWAEAHGVWVCDQDLKFTVARDTGVRADVYMPIWFAAFGDECVEAIGRLGVVRVKL
jgi:DNA N-6-adenine-methyltransferase Dam